ncbi:MAG: hypothetical protein HYV14_09450 [Elusimicrobia bacterium]|nr:hypothetical protein [Elusimicrobiota bacterium]
MRKPNKPKRGEDVSARKEPERPAPEPAPDEETLDEELDGAGLGKRPPDHEDEL